MTEHRLKIIFQASFSGQQGGQSAMEREKRAYIFTYGCQMNKHDSERMAGVLENAGYALTSAVEDADLILINACCVREKAEQKVYSQLGRLREWKKGRPSGRIAVGGCMAELEGERLLARASHVDLVFGTHQLTNLADILRELERCGKPLCAVGGENGDVAEVAAHRESTVWAWVSIMQGCDNFCTYCVVPYARGRERSRPSDEILRMVRELAEHGYKEVTLLGQNVNSYGRKSPRELTLAQLLSRLDAIPGLERIRFVTSHPKDLSDELIQAIRDLPKVCEHIHLPLQSGSDEVLRRMGRGYTVGWYLDRLDALRTAVPHISVTTDVMVGFPGESDDGFAATRRAILAAEYDNIFLFRYSVRPGTAAAAWGDPVPAKVKQDRFDELNALQRKITAKKHEHLEGEVAEVLVEGPSKSDSRLYTGRTRTNKISHFTNGGSPPRVGSIVPVYIDRARLHYLVGHTVPERMGG